MIRNFILTSACIASLVITSCMNKSGTEKNSVNELFSLGKTLSVIKDDELEEASGLVMSVANPDLFWTHNDSGDKARLFLIDKTGAIKTTVWLDSAKNRDWEDIAIGPGPVAGKTYLYVADIGDNESEFETKYIYRIEEPLISNPAPKDTTIKDVAVIKFQYPDGVRDAESLALDPLTRDIFIISKRELRANVYKIAYPQSTTAVLKAELVVPKLELESEVSGDTIRTNGEVLIRGYHPKYYYQIVAADISADGSEVLVKSYSTIYYWKREGQETIPDLLKRTPLVLPYDPEPQGEAIAFDLKGLGYYTINEKMKGKEQRLIYYSRK